MRDEKGQKSQGETRRRSRIFSRGTDTAQEPGDEVEQEPDGEVEEADTAATSAAQDGPVPLNKRLDALGGKTIAEALGDNSLMEIVTSYLSEALSSSSEVVAKFADVKDKYGSALMDELKERIFRAKQEGRSAEEVTAETTTFLGLRMPDSLLKQLDERRDIDGLSKSDFVRNAVRLNLRMAGLEGDGLQEQLDAMLNEVMGERLAHSLVAILAALGPNAVSSVVETSAAVLFYILGYAYAAAEGLPLDRGSLPFEKVREKAAELVSELRAEQEGLGDKGASESE